MCRNFIDYNYIFVIYLYFYLMEEVTRGADTYITSLRLKYVFSSVSLK